MTASPVDEELATAFARDGVACVRGVLDPAELASAARAIEIVLASPSPIAQVASAAEDPGSFFEDFCRWREIPEIVRRYRYLNPPRKRRNKPPSIGSGAAGSGAVFRSVATGWS
jgi:hypothetical protein